MSSNPFDRNKVKEAKLGAIITEPGEQNQRDAIHIAVAPIIAHRRFAPGVHIGVTSDGKTSTDDRPLVGIADPFLVNPIEKGQTFWLFLYQGQVTTLRHEWTHPAFPPAIPPETVVYDKGESEKWLRNFCETSDCPCYETVLARVLADDFRSDWDSQYFHFDGRDAHADIPREFWHHMSVVTGKSFVDPPTSFSCSC